MSEYLHPGVYIERKAGKTPAPIVGVSTSNFGICGYTKMGPVDEAILATSFEQFQDKFGGFTPKGLVPTELYAFFANGGRRAYISRAVASDAKKSNCGFEKLEVADEDIGTGDTSEVTFTDVLINVPVVPGSVTAKDTSETETFTDDGHGVLTGSAGGSGTIDYETGAITVTFNAAPAAEPILASYTQAIWVVEAYSEGDWGNNLRGVIQGNPDYWNAATATFTRWDYFVYLKNEDTLAFELKETFAELSFTDENDASYFPDVINDPDTGSKLMKVLYEATGGGVCADLEGVSKTAIAATGTDPAPDSSETVFTTNVTAAEIGTNGIAPGTLKVKWTDPGDNARVATDDGDGNLTGDGTGTVDYATGAVSIDCGTYAVKTGMDFTFDFYNLPEAEVCNCDFLYGTDGTVAIGRNQVTNPSLKASARGVYALGKTDEMMQVGVPDFAGDVTIAGDLITEAESRKDWFIILATGSGLTPQKAKTYRQTTLAANTPYAALYWPWIRITNPVTDRALDIPAIGHVAGVFARTDVNRNVGKSPGGMDDGKLNFSIGLEYDVELAEIDILNPVGVNSLYQSAETGRCVWGVRTLEIGGEFRYINAQRLFMFVEKSVFKSTHWVTFENNSADLQVRVRVQVESFMLNLFKNGYFAGATPKEAFFVVCGSTNNPPESVDLGRLVCDVGMAPNKPAEFVIYRLQQKTLAAAA